MKVDRVKYTAHYDEFGVLKDVWIGLESPEETDDPEKQLNAIKEITDAWYKKQIVPISNQYPPFSPPPNGNPYHVPIINKAEERLEIDIDNCTTMEQLMEYKHMLSSDRLAAVFVKKLSTLH